MIDLTCRCTGANPDPYPCRFQASAEDGLCDACRRYRCEERREARVALAQRLEQLMATGRLVMRA